MTDTIKVAVLGAGGRMGRTVVDAVHAADGLELVAELDAGDDLGLVAEAGAQVAVDFTAPAVTVENVLALIEMGVHAVVGTSGWTPAGLDRVREALTAKNVDGHQPAIGVLVAPNFALGAVLLMSFAKRAAGYFESVEIVELHHPDKVDAPSGTATHTAELMAEARKSAGVGDCPDATTSGLAGARGADVDGIRVHSVRLRGLIAHEEILLGNAGEQLTLRHDSFDRVSFMPGVVLAVREVSAHPGLTVGLEHYLGLR